MGLIDADICALFVAKDTHSGRVLHDINERFTKLTRAGIAVLSGGAAPTY
jgi:hypothetical protein